MENENLEHENIENSQVVESQNLEKEECPACGKIITSDSKFCTYCGCEIEVIKKQQIVPEPSKVVATYRFEYTKKIHNSRKYFWSYVITLLVSIFLFLIITPVTVKNIIKSQNYSKLWNQDLGFTVFAGMTKGDNKKMQVVYKIENQSVYFLLKDKIYAKFIDSRGKLRKEKRKWSKFSGFHKLNNKGTNWGIIEDLDTAEYLPGKYVIELYYNGIVFLGSCEYEIKEKPLNFIIF